MYSRPTEANSPGAFRRCRTAAGRNWTGQRTDSSVAVSPGERARHCIRAPLQNRAGAAIRDPAFYQYLVLADALRDGRVRERKYAEQELHRRFQKANAQSES